MTAVLARALWEQAARTLPVLTDGARTTSLAAIDRFATTPSPSAFLAASRTLSTALRSLRVTHLRDEATRRSFERGLAAVSAVPGLAPALSEELSSLPRDARAGRRLEALAALLTTHHELTGRVAAAADELRRMLDFDSFEPTPPPRRRAPTSSPR